MEDHLWNLKLHNLNGIGTVKIFYMECKKDFGNGCVDHTKNIIDNLFGNSKKSHNTTNTHKKNYYN